MSDPRLSSSSSIRLVAAAAAAVASLGVVALGVQLGTTGLVGDGPGRNPGSTSASTASATVDLPRARPPATLEELLVALTPGASVRGGDPSSATTSTPGSGEATSGPTGPPDGDAPPPPAPAPSPVPAPDTPTPPTLPVPLPTTPPILDPVVEPIHEVIDSLGLGDEPQQSETDPLAEPPSLDGFVTLLLGL